MLSVLPAARRLHLLSNLRRAGGQCVSRKERGRGLTSDLSRACADAPDSICRTPPDEGLHGWWLLVRRGIGRGRLHDNVVVVDHTCGIDRIGLRRGPFVE